MWGYGNHFGNFFRFGLMNVVFVSRHFAQKSDALLQNQILEVSSEGIQGNSAQRPTAEECLCYPWLQTASTPFLHHAVPLSVLELLVKYDARICSSKD